MAQRYIKVFFDWPEVTCKLSDAEQGRLIRAMVKYAKDGEEPDELTGAEQYLFPLFKAQLDRDAIAYEEISEKRREAGAMGGRAKQANASKCKQELATASKTSQDHDQDQDHEEDICVSTPKRKRFVPPTLEELSSFIREHGYTVDPQHFMDHYESVGWKIGRNTMKDWQAAVRNWARREQPFAQSQKPKRLLKFAE